MIPTIILITGLLLFGSSASGEQDGIACLSDFKSSVSDPDGRLSGWNFSNTSASGFICAFSGVSCWNPQENRVISLSLSSFNISGPIPSSLRFCAWMTTLDLSGNRLSGPIPTSLCTWLPYLTTLDLSDNSLTGTIPSELSNCRFLNTLRLSSNGLSGSVPSSLSLLNRLHVLDLSGNNLSGLIPSGLSRFGASSFKDNPSLRDSSLPSSSPSLAVAIVVDFVAGVFGFLLSLAISYLVSRFCFSAKPDAKKKRMLIGKKMMMKMKKVKVSPSGLIRVSLFQDPLEELILADLTVATGDFNPNNAVVAGSSDLGPSYRAVLSDGSALTVKRLRGCQLSEQQFREVMDGLGWIRHPNLVPLLGFCFLEQEKLLIYKYMTNGALSSKLRSEDENLDWPTRLRIGIGAARGLAWLHHGFQVPLVHQNFSSSVVLLDEDHEPRITDFGLAVLKGSNGGSSSHTKTDVYEFGVVLLELATDLHASNMNSDVMQGQEFSRNLVSWVLCLSAMGRMHEAIGRSLRGRGHDDQIVEVLKVACSCVVAWPEERPSMYEVYEQLKRVGGHNEMYEHFDEFPLLYK